jgi:hypothetical protein
MLITMDRVVLIAPPVRDVTIVIIVTPFWGDIAKLEPASLVKDTQQMRVILEYPIGNPDSGVLGECFAEDI